MEITRELNKESLMYSYTIYTTITNPTLNYILSINLPYCYHKVNML